MDHLSEGVRSNQGRPSDSWRDLENAAGPNGGRIAAAIICGDEWDAERVTKMLNSLQPHVDRVFVDWNGTKNSPSMWWLMVPGWTQDNIVIAQNEWVEDFSVARQRSFDMIPRDEFDWVLWIDTDDELVVDIPFAQLFAESDTLTQGWFMKYAYGVEATTQAVIVEQWRERLLRLDVDWRWTFPVHEVARGPVTVQWGEFDGAHIVHHRRGGAERNARERNRKILMKAHRENPDDPRTTYYLAHETVAAAEDSKDPQERQDLATGAIDMYKKYLRSAPINDDMYNAFCMIGDVYRMINQHNAAIDADLEAIKYYPAWPEAYIGIAKSYMEMQDWRRMWEFANLACQRSAPKTAAAREPMHDKFTPTFLRGLASAELGNLDAALEDYEEARRVWNPPPNELSKEPPLDKQIAMLEERMAKQRNSDVQDEERLRLRSMKHAKSICFFTNPLPEPWHPQLEAQNGSGGAEICVMELAKRFVADGWRTVVFGTPGDYRGVDEDGVEWWNSGEFTMGEHFDVVISSRAPHIFESMPNCDLGLLWLHDVNLGHYMGNFNIQPDGYVCLTEWHKRHTAMTYDIKDDRIMVVPNGVDLSRFPKETMSTLSTPRFVYSSSPDRGLDNVMGLWPEIKKRWPDAELDVFYGWNMVDAITSRDLSHPLERFRRIIMGAWEQLGQDEGGIHMRGRVPQAKLAEELMQKTAWLYPTTFLETFCITAVEMQLAGVVPVASKLAALNETVGSVEDLIEGWPGNVTYQKQWLNMLEITMEDHDHRAIARERNRLHAEQFTWDSAYEKWNDLFYSFGITSGIAQVAV